MAHDASVAMALYEPEIPPNTGNIARLCAATGTRLHLIEPLGFSLEDKYLKRAGLDYWPHVSLSVWPGWEEFVSQNNGRRIVPASARQGTLFHDFSFQPGDVILLGPETRGVPRDILEQHPDVVRIPIWGQVRSLNLSTAAGILLYEALRSSGGLPDA